MGSQNSSEITKISSETSETSSSEKTFKSSTAERVPNVQPAPIYLRYIRVPLQINCRASAEGVQLGYHAGNVEVLIVEY